MKKGLLTIAIVILFAGLGFSAKAGFGDNLIGWPWGGGTRSFIGDTSNTNFGWVSVNNLNCDTDGNLKIELVDNAPPGCVIGANVGGYGVSIPYGDGDVSGWAWSENVGWINFDPPPPYPASPNNSVARVGNLLTGWARIKSIQDAYGTWNSGDWQGWIKMSGTADDGSAYGVDVNKLKGAARTSADATYAWSDELGWIDFSRAEVKKTLKICQGSCDNNSFPNPVTSLNMLKGDTDNLRACYSLGNLCDYDGSGTDVTGSPTVWNELGTPNNSISLNFISPDEVVSGDSVGTENVRVDYNGESVNFSVNVGQVCTYYNCSGFDCVENTATILSGTCPANSSNDPSDPCTRVEQNVTKCGGTGINPSNWIEVAP